MSFPRYPEYKDSGVEWLGEVPAHWPIASFKRLVEFQNGADHKAVEVDYGYPVYGSGGVFAQASDYLYDGESVLLGRKGTIDKPLHVNGKFWTVDTMYWTRIREGASGRFCYYAATSFPFAYYSTNTALPSMTQSALGAHWVAYPPKEEQTTIAAFLDRETAKIDALVAEQETLIALLKEKRQAVISHAVTKGLNPDAPMKPSGIEWLGDVPAHWEASELRHIAREGTSITYGIVQAGPHVEDGVPYIRTSDMSGSALPLEGYPRTSAEIDASYQRSKVCVGDIVIAIRASVGKALPVPAELDGANLTQGTAKICPGASISGEFLLSYLSSDAAQIYFERMAKGATFKEITLDALRRAPVLVAPRHEQDEIQYRIQTLSNAIDGLIADSERSAVLLKERRSALISAAVTGQIDVRGLAG